MWLSGREKYMELELFLEKIMTWLKKYSTATKIHDGYYNCRNVTEPFYDTAKT